MRSNFSRNQQLKQLRDQIQEITQSATASINALGERLNSLQEEYHQDDVELGERDVHFKQLRDQIRKNVHSTKNFGVRQNSTKNMSR